MLDMDMGDIWAWACLCISKITKSLALAQLQLQLMHMLSEYKRTYNSSLLKNRAHYHQNHPTGHRFIFLFLIEISRDQPSPARSPARSRSSGQVPLLLLRLRDLQSHCRLRNLTLVCVLQRSYLAISKKLTSRPLAQRAAYRYQRQIPWLRGQI
jgi:hypothetical protein